MSNKLKQALSKIYYNTKNPASYSSVKRLHEEVNKNIPNIKIQDVKDWLKSQLTYTLHYPTRHNFKRNKIVVNRIDQQWEADLVDMKEFSKINNNFNYLLTVIDVFSKYAQVIALKQKNSESVVKAFKICFEKRKCNFLRTDRGKEFCNNDFQKYLKSVDVLHFTSKNEDIKCAIVERFNRTLKSRMFKYFTAKGTRRYIDELQNFVLAYNKAKHRTIKMSPLEVNKKNEKSVFRNIYGFDTLQEYYLNNFKTKTKNIDVGDNVRRKYIKKPFDKGYYPTWEDKVYTVVKTIKGNQKPIYQIQDEKQNIVKQQLYKEEIQLVKPDLFRIEKVINTRKRKGKTEYFVKWLNHSNEYNSWVTNIKIT